MFMELLVTLAIAAAAAVMGYLLARASSARQLAEARESSAAELAAALARPGRPEVDLADVVPAEPLTVAHGNGRTPRVHEEVPS